MVHFHTGLDSALSAKELQQLSLYLAHVCRNEAHSLCVLGGNPASHYGTSATILVAMKGLLNSLAK